jgi:hypothetical protein
MSSGKYRKEKDCLNCGHIVEEHYCSNCGQPNLELKENFWAFISHSIAHYFHFDNKFFQTLNPLLTKPGQVTLDYLAGKRARYINPVSMYIFVSIVYFIIVPKNTNKSEKDEVKITTEQADSLKRVLSKNLKNVDIPALGTASDILINSISKAEFKKLTLKDQETVLNNLKHKRDSLDSDEFDKTIAKFEKILIISRDSTYEAYLNRQKLLPETDRDNWFERVLKKREIIVYNKTEKEGWSYQAEIERYRPKQFFLLMPLMALFIMWNFRKNRIYYLDHLIFTIHGMTAFFIVQIVTVPIRNYIFGLESTTSKLISLAIFVTASVYLYKALKLFYGRPKGQTIKKMITLVILFSIAFWFSELIVKQFIFYFLI